MIKILNDQHSTTTITTTTTATATTLDMGEKAEDVQEKLLQATLNLEVDLVRSLIANG